jgi:alpha-beta hydrolase superfamily lysophospholipase
MGTDTEPRKRRPFLQRIFRWILLPLFSLYVLFCLWFYLFQEPVLLEQNEDPTGYDAKPDLQPALNDFLKPPRAKINFQKFDAVTGPPKGAIFYLHGNRGNIEKCRWEIEEFLNAGYDVWTMDYRTFGDSTGSLSEVALLTDAQMVYMRIQQEYKERDIIVWGRSFGSGIAAYVASVHSPDMLVLETPYWSLPDVVRHSYPILPPFLFRYRLPTHEYLSEVDCHVHLIHGTKDEKIPFESSERLEMHCNELEMEVTPHPIKDGLHNLRPKQEFDAVLKKLLE